MKKFLVLAYVDWEEITLGVSLPQGNEVAVKMEGKDPRFGVGFLPVFDSRDDAELAYPNDSIMEVSLPEWEGADEKSH